MIRQVIQWYKIDRHKTPCEKGFHEDINVSCTSQHSTWVCKHCGKKAFAPWIDRNTRYKAKTPDKEGL